MPNVHDIDKECLSVWLDRALMARLKKAAKAARVTVSSFVVAALVEETKGVVLTEEDYHAIATQIACRKAARDRRLQKTGQRLGIVLPLELAARLRKLSRSGVTIATLISKRV